MAHEGLSNGHEAQSGSKIAGLDAIRPSAAPAGTEVELSGPDLWSLRFIPDAQDLDGHVGPVYFGSFQGDFDREGGEEVFSRGGGRYRFYVITPTPIVDEEAAAPVVAQEASHVGVAGGVDVSLQFESNGFDGALAMISPDLSHMAEDGSRCPAFPLLLCLVCVDSLLCLAARAGPGLFARQSPSATSAAPRRGRCRSAPRLLWEVALPASLTAAVPPGRSPIFRRLLSNLPV